MEWGSAADWVSAVANVVVAVAAALAAWQGIRSLSAWREETIGRRRMELAEQVLADFYRARDVINHARSPLIFPDEGSGRPREADEDPRARMDRDRAYVPFARLAKEQELFSRIEARRYPFAAYFGEAAGDA